VDFHDDEGYRACLTSDDGELLVEFAAWLDANGIKYTHDMVAADGEFSVFTDWVTDRRKATLLKLTWGGR
jgi:hypothetical protein